MAFLDRSIGRWLARRPAPSQPGLGRKYGLKLTSDAWLDRDRESML